MSARRSEGTQRCLFCRRVQAPHAWIEERREWFVAYTDGVCQACALAENARTLAARGRDGRKGASC